MAHGKFCIISGMDAGKRLGFDRRKLASCTIVCVYFYMKFLCMRVPIRQIINFHLLLRGTTLLFVQFIAFTLTFDVTNYYDSEFRSLHSW